MSKGGGNNTIAFVLRRFGHGGVQRMAMNLMSSLKAMGFSPLLIVRHPGGELWPLLPNGIETIPLNTLSRLKALSAVAAILRQRRPDIVIASGVDGAIAMAAKTIAGSDSKIVIGQHGPFMRGVHRPLVTVKSSIYRAVLSKADGFLAVSEGVADDMSAFLGISRARISVIYNPVVTADHLLLASQPIDHPFFCAGGPPVFVGVGRLVEQKDFATTIAAFAKYLGTADGRLVIVGDGPLKGALREQCRALNINDRVAFLGAVENPIAYMARATALINSSIYAGLESVMVEALAAGTPVIGTNCEFGSAEILENGRCGWLVPVGNADAIATAMRDLVSRPESQMNVLRQAGQQRALAFSAERSTLCHVSLIQNLMAQKRRSKAKLSLDDTVTS